MGLENIPLPMEKPIKAILSTDKDMVSGFRPLEMGVSTKDSFLIINLRGKEKKAGQTAENMKETGLKGFYKDRESYLLREERFIRACLKMVRLKVQVFAKTKEKKFLALILSGKVFKTARSQEFPVKETVDKSVYISRDKVLKLNETI